MEWWKPGWNRRLQFSQMVIRLTMIEL
ncbi:unnamed protein product [Callosobruchus maculatus]|uniref:Uncharacterized protein n=1 Tax=Callosobruchus maculatus TaxID=64391 RepID=A0A653D1Q6_CALMS|nr:unnamed protein product [Callosobruchus maculatus]